MLSVQSWWLVTAPADLRCGMDRLLLQVGDAYGSTERTGAPPFDLTYLRSLHRQLFGEVYEWAGDVRTVDVSKGTTRFCTADRIAPEAERVMRELDGRDPSSLPHDEVIGHVAEPLRRKQEKPPFQRSGRVALFVCCT